MSSEYKRAIRHARRKRRQSLDEACAICGESDVRALQNTSGITLCAECRLSAAGRPPIEDHHSSGRRNSDTTVSMPANAHAALSDLQWDWPRETLLNPRKSPLRRSSAAKRARYDALSLLANQPLEDALLDEDLDEYLQVKLDDEWPEDFENFRRAKHQ